MLIIRSHIIDMKEEIFNPVFGKQRAAKDAHDFHDWSIDLQVMFDDTDKAIGDDGHMNLDTYGILGLAPEGLDPEMLLDPFEEEFDLPAVSVQQGDVHGGKVEVVGVVGEGSLQIRRIIDDSPEFCWIVIPIVLSRESYCLVPDDIVLSLEEILSGYDLIFRMPLLSNDKECARKIDAKESREVKVPSIKHIASQWLVREPIHGVDIMDVCIGDSVENRNLCDDINLGVDFDTRLCRTKLCPSKDRQAQVDGRRVDGIKSAVKFKLSDDALLLRNLHHVKRKLLKDAVVSNGICLGEQASIDGGFPETEMIRLLFMCDNNISEFSQTAASKKLTKHQNEEVRPMGRSPIMSTVIVLLNKSFEESLWQEFNDLTKNIFLRIHISIVLNNDANIRISNRRHGFYCLNNCA